MKMRLSPASTSLAVLLLGAACLGQAAQEKSIEAESVADPYGRLYPPRIYHTVRLQGPPPSIDGRLDDEAWTQGEWSGDFVQQIPNEGAPPSQPTELKILYDDENVYMAVRAYDDPDLVHRYAARRDSFVGDVVGICFDSYNDKRTGFEFDLMAGGAKIDLILTNDGWDTTWDAVWYGKTGLEEDAWTAEFQVPLSQLRYGSHDEQVWGLHAWRWISRYQEESHWNLVPRSSTGPLYNLGELHGIRGLPENRRIELLPHVVGEVDAAPEEAGDPYSGTTSGGSAGLDAKLGLSTDFTLDATLNPDFGQVEADPSVVNLTAYEVFFEEKRPFFLEGKNIFEFNLNGDQGGDMLFYSRRIGAPPSYSPELGEGESLRGPDWTTILSALKVSGKTRDGLSLGIVQSLGAKETARISSSPGEERRQVVEPWSSYFTARVHKDWDKGNTGLGGMLTHTHRWISDPALVFLPANALTGGLDFVHYFGRRSWVLEAKGVFSRVAGDPAAIRELQTNAVHYFQRPDAGHLQLDEAATSLSGHGGSLRFGRYGSTRWRIWDRFRWSSPGLELNDLGFLRQADVVSNTLAVGYEETRPWGPFRSYSVFLEREDAWDFGGLQTDGTVNLSASANFRNRWGLGGSLRFPQEPVDTRRLRGGPALKLSRFVHMSLEGHTDHSRRVAFSARVHGHTYADGASSRFDITPGFRLRLSNALALSASFDYSEEADDLQYVDTPETNAEPRYVIGHIEQQTLSATFRVNLNLTPDLSIQFYGSPFVSSGRYTAFKSATDTLAERYEDRFHLFGPEEVRYRPEDNSYEVRESEGGATYSFANPDFGFRQFRSNLVVRWEYRPGSSLYVVWSQGRTSESELWDGSIRNNLDALWAAAPRNVFLIKLQHWFSQ